MSRYKIKPLFPGKLKTISLLERPSKADISHFARVFQPGDEFNRFLDSLPRTLAGHDFKEFVNACKSSRKKKKPIIFASGAHLIKVGLNPVLIDLMKNDWISCLTLNGAGIIHDFEIALAGKTSEDVSLMIRDGRFGAVEETGEMLNTAIQEGFRQDIGLGEAVGQMMAEKNFPYKEHSLLFNAFCLNIPVTVHVAIGTDIIHFHPGVSGEALGKTSLRDFFLFCSLVEKLEGGGIYLNIGSAVILPEIFLKAVSYIRNRGTKLENFVTAVFDFNLHYRPKENVVKRPLRGKGKGYYFIGHHEIMIPLLAAALQI